MGEGFERSFFGLGAVSPPALTPRVNKGRSVGATAKPSGVTAWRPSAQVVLSPDLAVPPLASCGGKKKIFLPPFCLAFSLKIISYTLMDHFELKKKEEIKFTKERKRTSHFS